MVLILASFERILTNYFLSSLGQDIDGSSSPALPVVLLRDVLGIMPGGCARRLFLKCLTLLG